VSSKAHFLITGVVPIDETIQWTLHTQNAPDFFNPSCPRTIPSIEATVCGTASSSKCVYKYHHLTLNNHMLTQQIINWALQRFSITVAIHVNRKRKTEKETLSRPAPKYTVSPAGMHGSKEPTEINKTKSVTKILTFSMRTFHIRFIRITPCS
jgi:hypothetical protein